jgi:hypothetical protein
VKREDITMKITNTAIKAMKNGTLLCPVCKKFFSIKHYTEAEIKLVNKHGSCRACYEKEEVIKMAKRKVETIFIPPEGSGEVILPGPRGVTKHQMIAAINRNIDIPANIEQLATSYPSTFYGSLQYVKKAVREKAYEIVGKPDTSLDQEKMELIQLLQPSRKGITYHQVIIALEKAADECDYVLINKIYKYFPEQFTGALKYMAKKYSAALTTALNMEYDIAEGSDKLVAKA